VTTSALPSYGPAQGAEQHGGVVHEAFAVALAALRQHRAEVFQSPSCHICTTRGRGQERAPHLGGEVGAWPFWAKRCDSEPLARKATVPS
jgi:hypothetical protein